MDYILYPLQVLANPEMTIDWILMAIYCVGSFIYLVFLYKTTGNLNKTLWVFTATMVTVVFILTLAILYMIKTMH